MRFTAAIRSRHRFTAFFLWLGLFSGLAQFSLLREAVTVAQGNEAAYVLVLFLWLIGTGVGSLVALQLIAGTARSMRRVFWLPVAVAAVLLVGISSLRLLASAGGLAGQVLSPVPALFLFSVGVLPLSLSVGLSFVVGVRDLAPSADRMRDTANRGYLTEVIGFAAAGLVYRFLLFRIDALTLALLLAAAAALFLATGPGSTRRRKAVLAVAVTSGLILLIPFLGTLERASLGFWYGGAELVQSENTRFQHVAVTERGGQHDIFASGRYAGSVGLVRDAEILTHLTLTNLDSVQRVLVIGGLGATLQEVLKYPVSQAIYTEADPALIGIVAGHDSGLRQALDDPRVQVVTTDGRRYLGEGGGPFDAILLSADVPTSLDLNRFHTVEFYEAVRSRLTDSGVLGIALPYGIDTADPLSVGMAGTAYRSLAAVFPHVLVLPEDGLLFVASSGGLDYASPAKMGRLVGAGIAAEYVSPEYLEYRYGTERIDAALATFGGSGRVNTDLDPSLYLDAVAREGVRHSSRVRFVGASTDLLRNSFWPALIVLALLIPPFLRRGRRQARYGRFIALLAGMGLLFEILLVYLFQVSFGFLYSELAVLLSLLMFGFAAGAAVFLRHERRLVAWGLRSYTIPLLVFALAAPFLVLDLPFKRQLIWTLCFLLGTIQGLAFPLVNSLYGRSVGADGYDPGKIYGAELVGAALAAPAGLVLIPVWGLLPVFDLLIGLSVILCVVSLLPVRRR